MKAEVIHNGITHGAALSLWDKRAATWCGAKFKAGEFKERTLHGSVDCPDCKAARKAEKASRRGRSTASTR